MHDPREKYPWLNDDDYSLLLKRASLLLLSERAQLERTVLKRVYGLEEVPLAIATVLRLPVTGYLFCQLAARRPQVAFLGVYQQVKGFNLF